MQPITYERYLRCILEYPRAVLGLLSACVLLAACLLPRLEVEASADSLLLEDDRSLHFYRDIHDRFKGGDQSLLVAYAPDHPLFSDQGLERLQELREQLSAVRGVESVRSILDVPLLFQPGYSVPRLAVHMPTLEEKNTDRTAAKKELSSSPLYRNLLLSEDGLTTALVIEMQLIEGLDELQREIHRLQAARSQRELSATEEELLQVLQQEQAPLLDAQTELRERGLAEIREVIAPYRADGQLHLGGVPMIVADMVRFIKRDFLYFGVGILAFILISLGMIFRRRRWVAIPVLACAVAAIVMSGMLAALGWTVTVISANYLALQFIITLSIVVHLAVRYRELCADNPQWSQKKLIEQATRTMVRPCFYMVLTTLVAFSSLWFSGVRPVIDFGKMMALGILISFAVCFLFVPSALALLPREQLKHKGAGAIGRFTAQLAIATEHHGRLVLLAAFVIGVLAATGLSRLDVENRFIDYFDEDTEISRGMRMVDERLGGTTTLEVILGTDERANPDREFSAQRYAELHEHFFDEHPGYLPTGYWYSGAGLRRIEQVHDYLDGLKQTGKVTSLATLGKVLVQLNEGRPINSYQLALIHNRLPASVKDTLLEPYLFEDQQQTRIQVRLYETSSELERNELIQSIRAHLVEELGFAPEHVQLTGIAVLYNNLLQSLYVSQIMTLGFVFVAIFLVIAILFRSLKLAMTAIVPNVLVALAVLGFMGWAGIPLDIMSITIASITLGVGVDDTIHYLHRYRAELANSTDDLGAMRASHATIGRAMTCTSLIIISGFAILTLSNFTPSVYFGMLTALAMVMALLAAMTLLPKLMLMVRPLA